VYAVLCQGENPEWLVPGPSDALVSWQALYSYLHENKQYPELTALYDKVVENEPVGAEVELVWLNKATLWKHKGLQRRPFSPLNQG
jgi:hypothetical protein